MCRIRDAGYFLKRTGCPVSIDRTAAGDPGSADIGQRSPTLAGHHDRLAGHPADPSAPDVDEIVRWRTIYW